MLGMARPLPFRAYVLGTAAFFLVIPMHSGCPVCLLPTQIGWVRNSESGFLGEEGSLLVHQSTAVTDPVRGMPRDVE